VRTTHGGASVAEDEDVRRLLVRGDELRRRTEARGRVQLGLEKRAEDGRKRKSRVLPEVARHADSADARRIEKMATMTISTTTVVMAQCWSRAQHKEAEEEKEGEETRMEREEFSYRSWRRATRDRTLNRWRGMCSDDAWGRARGRKRKRERERYTGWTLGLLGGRMVTKRSAFSV
jgi:hypothetical protein